MLRIIRRPCRAAVLLACVSAVSGCAVPARQETGANAGAVAACRSQTEQAFNRQNRDLLSFRNGRDSPFSDSYDSGITSAGLSRRYARDEMMSSCLKGAGISPGAGNISSFSPGTGGTASMPGP